MKETNMNAFNIKEDYYLRQFLNSKSVSSVAVNLCLNGMESDMGYASQAEGIVLRTQMVPVSEFIILRMNSWSIWLMVKD